MPLRLRSRRRPVTGRRGAGYDLVVAAKGSALAGRVAAGGGILEIGGLDAGDADVLAGAAPEGLTPLSARIMKQVNGVSMNNLRIA